MRKSQGLETASSQIVEKASDGVNNAPTPRIIQSILVVDPDPNFSSIVSDYLKLFGYNICYRTDIEEAYDYARGHKSDVIFLADNFDYHHPIDVLRRFKAMVPNALIAILANKGDDQLAVELLKSGADDYLSRRVKDKDILTSIASLLEKLAENAPFEEISPREGKNPSTPPIEQSPQIEIDRSNVMKQPLSKADRNSNNKTPMLEHLPGVLLFMNKQFEIVNINKKCVNLFGFDKNDLLGQAIQKFIPKQIYADFESEVSRYVNSEVDQKNTGFSYSLPFELVIITHLDEGIPIRCQISYLNLQSNHGDSEPGFLLSIEDLTEEKSKQAELLYQTMWSNLLQAFAHRFINLKLEMFSEELTSVVSETANFFKLDRVSIYLFDKSIDKAKIYLEWTKREMDSLKLFSKKIEIDRSLLEFERLLAGESQYLEPTKKIEDPSIEQCCGISEHYAQVNALTTMVLPIHRANKVIGWVALDYQSGNTRWNENDLPMIEPLGQLFSEAFTLRAKEEQRKVTHQKLSENHGRLSEQAFLDGLTKLANRRYFDKVLESEVRRASRDKTNIALLFCDVDYFKAYNDTYGHLEGDLCLKLIAEVLQQEFQRAGDFVARFGGEEFAVILSGSLANDAQEAAEKLRQHIVAKNIEHRGSPLGKIALSIGISSVIAPDPNDSKKLLAKADKALYKAKSNGRNRVEVSPFSPR